MLLCARFSLLWELSWFVECFLACMNMYIAIVGGVLDIVEC